MVIPGIGGERAFTAIPGPNEGIIIPGQSPPANTPVLDMSRGLVGLTGPKQFAQNPLWRSSSATMTQEVPPAPFQVAMEKINQALTYGGMKAGLATLAGAA